MKTIGTYTIDLRNMKFYANIGAGAEERKIGTNIIVNVSVDVEAHSTAFVNDDINGAPDYAEIYDEVRKTAKEPVCLLERFAYKAACAILERVGQIVSVTVSVTKVNPPISGADGLTSSVKFGITRARYEAMRRSV